ncbi:C40 family peptidase [Planosporangium flavigriseum]|nr:C40 family peptidase [Planosporangium flavigriseum]NJC64354.1 C40 family peptidase [Planosporangium flavigriseum]
MTESIALETAGQQLRKLDADLTETRRTGDATHAAWTKASKELSELRDRVSHEAGEAYKAATALGPLDTYASDLHELSVLAPGIGQQPGSQATARDLEHAEQTEHAALAAHQAATNAATELSRTRDSTKAEFDKRTATLTDLRTQNAVEYQRELAAIDTQQAALGAGMNIGAAVKGMDANPKAKRALQYAISKRGSTYIFGHEGPNTFDCSGLVLWSYTQPDVGASLPRVANDQYWATRNKPVQVDSLLPGDLLFFATDNSDWHTVHHVGMYVGNGYMVHAPTTGDVVKISPVWWSEFYRATRVFDAVPATSPVPSPPRAPAAATTQPPASSAPPASSQPPASSAPPATTEPPASTPPPSPSTTKTNPAPQTPSESTTSSPSASASPSASPSKSAPTPSGSAKAGNPSPSSS